MENVQAGHVNNKHQEHLASECISTQWLKTTGNAQWLSELLATMQATGLHRPDEGSERSIDNL